MGPLACLVPALLAALPGPQNPAPSPPDTLHLHLQKLLDTQVADNGGRGGGVFRVGLGPVWEAWNGTAGTLELGGAPMLPEAAFEIASTSKAMTAALLLLLQEEGRVDLDAPVARYLPPGTTTGLLVIGGHDYGPEITLRQCLAHTAGLPDYWNDPPYVLPGVNRFLFDYLLRPQRFWQPDEILPYVRDLDPIFVPGTGWHYSDSGFLLAGMVAEAVTGQSLRDALRMRIFQPLGMQHTWLRWRDPDPPGLVLSHRYEGRADMTLRRHNSADWAGGGLASTTRDLDRFLRGIATGALFQDPASRQQLMAWRATGQTDIEYGLGLFRVRIGFGLGWVWGHDGYGNSFAYYWPERDATFTGTLNQAENNDWWPLLVAAALELGR